MSENEATAPPPVPKTQDDLVQLLERAASGDESVREQVRELMSESPDAVNSLGGRLDVAIHILTSRVDITKRWHVSVHQSFRGVCLGRRAGYSGGSPNCSRRGLIHKTQIG